MPFPDPFDARQLQVFVTLARTRNFTNAASELNLTQSAVSHSIRSLENHLERKLFNRQGRHITLTETGEFLQREATEILRLMDQTRRRLETIGSWGAGRLRVATVPSLCQTLLPEVLREFQQSFPRCAITVQPGEGPRCLERLRENEVDLIALAEPEAWPNGITRTPFFEDELIAILPPFSPLAARKRIPAAALADYPLMLYSTTSRTYSIISDFLRENGVTLERPLEMGSIEAMKEMVKLGQGVALMPEWAAERELALGSLICRPLAEGRLRRQWCLAWLKGRQLSLFEETFNGLCHEACDRLLRKNVVQYPLPA